MMLADSLGECARLPAVQPCRKNRDMVNLAALQWHVSTDGLEAFAPEKLASAPNIFNICKSIIVLKISFTERSTGNSEPLVFTHLANEKLKMVRLERNIGVEISDHIKGEIPHSFITGIKRSNLARKMPLLARRHLDELNPLALGRGLAHDFIRLVGRAIAYDHPPQWTICLRNH